MAKRPKYRLGDRVRTQGLHQRPELDGLEATVVKVLGYLEGQGCCTYVVDPLAPDLPLLEVCDHMLIPAGPPALPIPPINTELRATVPWSSVGWQPDMQRLPGFISAELNRLAQRRWKK